MVSSLLIANYIVLESYKGEAFLKVKKNRKWAGNSKESTYQALNKDVDFISVSFCAQNDLGRIL